MFDWSHPRLNELIADGYMALHEGRYIVTHRGLMVLFTCADLKIEARQLVAPSLPFERYNDAIGRVQALAARPPVPRG